MDFMPYAGLGLTQYSWIGCFAWQNFLSRPAEIAYEVSVKSNGIPTVSNRLKKYCMSSMASGCYAAASLRR
jgi:hypothetical protein